MCLDIVFQMRCGQLWCAVLSYVKIKLKLGKANSKPRNINTQKSPWIQLYIRNELHRFACARTWQVCWSTVQSRFGTNTERLCQLVKGIFHLGFHRIPPWARNSPPNCSHVGDLEVRHYAMCFEMAPCEVTQLQNVECSSRKLNKWSLSENCQCEVSHTCIYTYIYIRWRPIPTHMYDR